MSEDGVPRWQGDEICKKFLVKFCPNDLFHNTKSDRGTCLKKHDEKLKSAFEAANDEKFKVIYSAELLKDIEAIINDVVNEYPSSTCSHSLGLSFVDACLQ